MIVTYFFRAQQFRRLAKVAGEQRDMQDVRSLGVRRQVPHLHVLNHALKAPVRGGMGCACSHPRLSQTELSGDGNAQATSGAMPLPAAFRPIDDAARYREAV